MSRREFLKLICAAGGAITLTPLMKVGKVFGANVTSTNATNILDVGKISEEGKPIFNGVSVYSTNSTGKLGFLNNMVGIFKVELDKMGNFVNKEWEWK